MKALFKHLSAITQGNPGKVVLAPSRPRRYHTLPSASNISVPFLSTTLLAALLGVPQVPIFGSGKAIRTNHSLVVLRELHQKQYSYVLVIIYQI
ncbi:MAG: hypothetical protein HC917_23490 [Richelia sp. SM2_1_7]|nr:hypothetical protein [Richelia sp. SM2_1_7]